MKSDQPLRLPFTLHRVNPRDPAERFFVESLMKIEADLEKKAKGPIAIPFYGRARALGALYGDDLSKQWITKACVFVTGACSCQIRDLNPGTDMLFLADWEAFLENRLVKDPEIPALMSLAGAAALHDGEATSTVDATQPVRKVAGQGALNLGEGQPTAAAPGADEGVDATSDSDGKPGDDSAVLTNALIAVGVGVVAVLIGAAVMGARRREAAV